MQIALAGCIKMKIIKKTKAQMKIQQMAFMLMAVTLLFVLAGLFFLVVGLSGLKDSATDLREKNAMLLVTRLSNSPEFSCGRAFDNAGTNCIDADKVMIVRENAGKYKDYWGEVSNIKIEKIYPSENNIECNLGNYPDCSTIRILGNETSGYYSSNFVSLCRKATDGKEVYDKCEVAKLFVSYNEVE